MTFRPGQLSAPEAARLNEMYNELERWKRLSVAYPLTLTRGAGSVTISAGGVADAFTPRNPETPVGCGDYRDQCEGGYLRRYRCDSEGNWVYDRDLDLVCPAVVPGPPPPPPPPPGTQTTTPLALDIVSRVCVQRGGVRLVTGDITLDGAGGVVHVDATAAAVTVTLPDPATDPKPYSIKKVDSSGNAVTIDTAAGDIEFGSSISLAAQGDWQPLYTDGTDWFIGVLYPVLGVTQEVRHAVIRAPGSVSAAECLTDTDDCCTTRTTTACCPDGSLDTLQIVLEAPVGLSGDEVTFAGDLVLTDAGVWETTEPIVGSGGLGAASTSLTAKLYCDPVNGGWWLEGTVTDTDGTVRQFSGPLEDVIDGTVLTGSIALVGEDTAMEVIVDHPCADGFVPGDCIGTDDCGTCTPISTRWSFADVPEAPTEAGNVSLLVGFGCRFRSDDSVWTLEYNADAGQWEFRNTSDDRLWIRLVADWDCCGMNEMTSDDMDVANMTLTPLFDCCPEVVTYDCTDGECVEAGTLGDFATLELCEAACGVAPSCCSGAIPSTIYAHFTSVSACSNISGLTIELSDTGDPGAVWAMSGSTGGSCGVPTFANFTCATGVLNFGFGTDNNGTGAPLTFNCSPFEATYEITLTFTTGADCCSGTVSVTLNGTP